MEEDGSPSPANREEPHYLRLIGLSTVHHSLLDYYIRKMIYRLAELKLAVGETITKHQTTTRLLSTLKGLAATRVPDASLKQAILTFIKDAAKANVLRNDVVHGLWADDQFGNGIRIKQTQTIPAANLGQLPEIESNNLKTLIRDFERLIHEAQSLLDQLH